MLPWTAIRLLTRAPASAGVTSGQLWPTTFLAGQAIVLDPAGPLFAAIGAGNLRAFTDGTDTVGHQATSN